MSSSPSRSRIETVALQVCQAASDRLTDLASVEWVSGVQLFAVDEAGVVKFVDPNTLSGGGGGGASSLDGLSDVIITSPASGNFLRYNGTQFVNATITAGDLPTGIDAAKIGGGAVSSTEFGYLDGVTSAIQTQIDSKAASSHTHTLSQVTDAGTAAAKNAPASGVDATSTQVVMGDDSRLTDDRTPLAHGHPATSIGSGNVSDTEFGYLDGVTSAIQTQINGKQASDATLTALAAWGWTSGREVPTFTAADTLSILRVGTSANDLVQLNGSGKLPAVDGSQLTGITGGASSLDGLSDVAITSPASGNFIRHNGTQFVNAGIAAGDIPSGVDATKIGSGTVSNTVFGYLAGVTSAIQTQLDAVAAPVTGKISSNTDYTGSSDAFTIEPASLTITLPSAGCWLIDVHLNFYLTSAGVTTQYRMALGTATINGSTNYPTGFAYAQGASGTANSKITTGSPTLIGGTSKSSGENALVLIGRHAIDVSGAGTIKVQIAIGGTTSNVAKLLAGSHIRASKL